MEGSGDYWASAKVKHLLVSRLPKDEVGNLSIDHTLDSRFNFGADRLLRLSCLPQALTHPLNNPACLYAVRLFVAHFPRGLNVSGSKYLFPHFRRSNKFSYLLDLSGRTMRLTTTLGSEGGPSHTSCNSVRVTKHISSHWFVQSSSSSSGRVCATISI